MLNNQEKEAFKNYLSSKKTPVKVILSSVYSKLVPFLGVIGVLIFLIDLSRSARSTSLFYDFVFFGLCMSLIYLVNKLSTNVVDNYKNIMWLKYNQEKDNL